MNQTKLYPAACLVALSPAGCASVAVTQDALVDRTAHALGLEKINSR